MKPKTVTVPEQVWIELKKLSKIKGQFLRTIVAMALADYVTVHAKEKEMSK